MSLSHLESEEIQIKDDVIIVSGFSGKLRSAEHKNCSRGTGNFYSIGSYNVICCGRCYLRVKFPSYIKTQKQLKDYFENKDYEKPDRFELLDFEEENEIP